MHQVITVTIHDLSRGGSGVARLESGEIVFVPYTAPGDQVSIRIIQKEKNYSQGELVEVISPSPVRVKPLCPVFQKCGGCSWQHLPYSLQFETKKSGVLHALKRAGLSAESIPLDEIPAKNPFFYRNRIQIRGNPVEKSFGFYERESTRIVNVSDCKIARKEINEALPQLREEGMGKDREFKVEVEVSEQGEVRAAWNRKHAAFGFRQVNDEQNQELRRWVKEQVGTGTLLLDLFGGAGNLSLSLVDQFREIHCVDTQVPREKPPGTPAHFHFERASVVWWLQNTSLQNSGDTCAILDPPREGLGSDFSQIEHHLSQKFSPKTLILVGCDADSFARDASRFIKKGYALDRIGVLDLFPQTPHVESLAVLKKNTLK